MENWSDRTGPADHSDRMASPYSPTPRPAPSRRSLAAGLLLALLFLPGCLGPSAIRQTRLKYNHVFQQTNDEQLLLNIVRLRYGDTPVFIDLPNITGQFESAASGGYNSPIDMGTDPGFPGFGVGQLTLRDNPTLSYHPRQGHEIAETLVQPLNAEAIRAISPGTDTFIFLMMALDEANDVPNAPLSTSMAPRTPDDNHQFRELADLVVRLQERRAIDLSVASFEGEPLSPIPAENLDGAAVVEAARDGFAFRTDGPEATLRKRERSLVLKIAPQEASSPDTLRLLDLLQLRPGRPFYRIQAEQRVEEENPSDNLLPPPLTADNTTIVVNMRSILDMMTFLSKGVCVPPEHIDSRVAPMTVGPDGALFDWRRVTRDILAIGSQKHRPKTADVAVQYRGYWYYIDESDVRSRTTLTLLELLLELQEVETTSKGPLLTLPL
jgi:hypothetical protein